MKKLSSNSKRKKRLSAEQRQEVLLKAARDAFSEKGYEGTSLDDIIRRAGGSRRSIYTQFGGKEGLFKALMVETAGQALVPMHQAPDEENSLEKTLFCFADRLLSALFTPAALDLSRLALADGSRFPELAKVYFESGPESAEATLAVLLDSAEKRGEIDCRCVRSAAGRFIGMLRDNLYLQVLLRLRPAPEHEEKETLIQSAVEIFLCGIKKRAA
jgi:AcrR family transcriptional regulator